MPPLDVNALMARGRLLLQSLGHAAGAGSVRGEILGVDLGGSSIKLTRVRRGKGRPELLDYAEATLPQAQGEDPASRREGLKQLLKGLVASRKLKGRQAVGLVYGIDVTLRRTVMPDMPRADLLSALELEAHKFVPFPAERIALDYEILGHAAEQGQLDILVAVCDREKLAETHDILTYAGLKVRGITVPPLAFRSVMRHTRLSDSQEVTALFDVGHLTTNLCIFKQDELRFSRELSLGSFAFTEALRTIIVPGQGTLKLTEQEAERLKLEHGIPMGEDEKKTVGGVTLAHVAVMLRPTLERLVREIWSSFDYCNEEFFGDSVQRVFLTGRGARLKNLAIYLESVLRVPVAILDVGMELSTGHANAEIVGGLGFAPALGLEDFTGINLVRALESPEGAPVRAVVRYLTLPRLAAAALLAIAVDASLAELRHQGAHARVDAAEKAQARMTLESPELAKLEARMRATQGRETVRAQLALGAPEWALILKDLSLRMGPMVRLREMRPEMTHPDPAAQPGALPEQRLVLDAFISEHAERPELEVAQTLRSLMSSAFLTDVRLVESAPVDTFGTRVQISCGLRGAP